MAVGRLHFIAPSKSLTHNRPVRLGTTTLKPMTVLLHLVVARYREELNWLRKVPRTIGVTVYDKSGDDVQPNAVPLPNVGREAHTYLQHLVSHYDELAEYTIFCQGKPFDHAYDFHKTLRGFAEKPDEIGEFRWLGHTIDTDTADGHRLFRTWSKNDDGRGLDLRGFHRQLFGIDGPERYAFVLGAQFAVRRDLVRRRPKAFYERALEISVSFPDAAHCFERTWDRVLGVQGIDPVWLDGRETVYLKLVKRHAELRPARSGSA